MIVIPLGSAGPTATASNFGKLPAFVQVLEEIPSTPMLQITQRFILLIRGLVKANAFGDGTRAIGCWSWTCPTDSTNGALGTCPTGRAVASAARLDSKRNYFC